MNQLKKHSGAIKSKSGQGLFVALLLGAAALGGCTGNNTGVANTGQNIDSLANAQKNNRVTVKDRQVFHAREQRTIDSLQKLVDHTDRTMKSAAADAKNKWDGTRDSMRRVLDHANRVLNNQAYKADAEWGLFKRTVSTAIDSAEVIWNKKGNEAQ